MKQKFYLIIPALLLFTTLAAQIPNSSFENWTSTKSFTPKFWTKFTGKIDKVNLGASNKAIKLENDLINKSFSAIVSDKFKGYDSIGSPIAGFPYSSKPDSLKITWRYNMAVGDTFSVSCFLKKSGKGNISFAFYSFSGSKSNYHTIGLPLFTSDTSAPDSAFIVITSGNLDKDPVGNGFLEIDNISFVDSFNVVKGAIPNGNFNDWDSVSYDKLNSWITTNDIMNIYEISPITPNVGRITASYNGNYAIEMRNIKLSSGDTLSGSATTDNGSGFPDEDEPQFPINKRFNALEGYFMYTKGGSDYASVKINVFKDTLVGSGEFYYDTTVTSFQKFIIPIEYSAAFAGIPDSATIFLSSSDKSLGTINLSSIFIVDYLTLTEWPVGINNKGAVNMKMNAFPNPTNNNINLTYYQQIAGNTEIEITDLTGKVISKNVISGNQGKQTYNINVLNWNNGFYLAKVNTGTQSGVIKFTVQK